MLKSMGGMTREVENIDYDCKTFDDVSSGGLGRSGTEILADMVANCDFIRQMRVDRMDGRIAGNNRKE